ncbi:GNAT family N-acetyltransferase [Phaeovibrio sulfidiphilus]|uniref:GNAT family N-acetyltransferase n=1 Tax=Phaeovibrio sulfidiphilus TaxID=1220600 RepID=A0A8J6YPK5_9PROT|nr:GNAT family N-acetyltransferase [Phaeovibrio sulfidiphilus]MBE1237674.1 GNAT family N-acetyltransferase [Phaeovibrio sulfidiphilus]
MTDGHLTDLLIEEALISDLDEVQRLDALVTAHPKPDHWRLLIEGSRTSPESRFFLVARRGDRLLGLIAGEIRVWEFGSPPCGWIYTVAVDPDARETAVGTRLFQAICARFRRQGASTVRTMVGRNEHLVLSFFRSQGMMAGPFVELEMEIRP